MALGFKKARFDELQKLTKKVEEITGNISDEELTSTEKRVLRKIWKQEQQSTQDVMEKPMAQKRTRGWEMSTTTLVKG